MKILIDNGHGRETLGKRSPDGSLREYKWAREIASRLEQALKQKGLDAERIVKEENDVSLGERSRRVNSICQRLGTANVILVSIHCNAAPPNDNRHRADVSFLVGVYVFDDSLDVSLDDCLFALFREEIGDVLFVVLKQVLSQDGGAGGLSENPKVRFKIGVSVRIIRPHRLLIPASQGNIDEQRATAGQRPNRISGEDCSRP